VDNGSTFVIEQNRLMCCNTWNSFRFIKNLEEL